MTINCKGNLIDLSSPKVMGILNITPDSFYDGGKYKNESEILSRVEKMMRDGVDLIDLGAYSSRPGAKDVTTEEELFRSVPVTELIVKNFPETIISIDTFRSQVAKENVLAGASIINDIAAGSLDAQMIPTVGKLQVPYIMMHMKQTPQDMQKHTEYQDIVREMLYYFSEKVSEARSYGINDLIIDPGFGFAKTLEQNYEVLNKLELFDILELPILVGVSRKSMIYKLLNSSPVEALNGTTVINTISLMKGANILRVHDVKEAVEAVKIYNQLKD
ncbi:dihydropteroate synthase [Zhouia amylolytica]|nr:dihydropteroate synthase [Zhouia amylolytica]